MIEIQVTRKHIKDAIKIAQKYDCVSSNSCPIALAIKEKTHKKVYVISPEDINIDGKVYEVLGNRYVSAIDNFISNFDNGLFNKARPIKFKIARDTLHKP